MTLIVILIPTSLQWWKEIESHGSLSMLLNLNRLLGTFKGWIFYSDFSLEDFSFCALNNIFNHVKMRLKWTPLIFRNEKWKPSSLKKFHEWRNYFWIKISFAQKTFLFLEKNCWITIFYSKKSDQKNVSGFFLLCCLIFYHGNSLNMFLGHCLLR